MSPESVVSDAPLLEVRDLCTVFDTEDGIARAVDGVSFRIGRGEVLCLVGESGSGKSVTALSILGLVPPPGRIAGGEVIFLGRNLRRLSQREQSEVRGRQIAIVLQEAAQSLNPVLRCGEQLAEVLQEHGGLGRRAAALRAVELLHRVHLPDAELQARRYAHQMSGGMCQRVMLAMALASAPRLLIADEPTTGLDVTIQAQILDLILEMRASQGMAILLITHDLGVVTQVGGTVAVMYAGRVVETGPVDTVLRSPRHPYTRALLECQAGVMGWRRDKLPVLPGAPPHPARLPDHCRFEPRCSFRIDRCVAADPTAREVAQGQYIRCFVDLPGGHPSEPTSDTDRGAFPDRGRGR